MASQSDSHHHPVARSLCPGSARNYVPSLGLPSVQERWTCGTQATATRRLPQPGAAHIAVGMLTTSVRTSS